MKIRAITPISSAKSLIPNIERHPLLDYESLAR